MQSAAGPNTCAGPGGSTLQGYPHEHSRRRGGGAGWQPLPLWDGGGGGFAPRRHCYWSEYYDTHGRNPENVTAAPWVMS